MPNHCSNSLTVSGPAEDLDAFFTAVAAGESDNFISTFVPMPEELRTILTGSATVDGERVTEWREVDGQNVAITAMERQHLVDLHGTCDWYQWTQSHWGTKWGAYDVDVNRETHRITYDSAWAPPEVAIVTISEKFPTLSFQMAYAEGGMGYFGEVLYENGDPFNRFDGTDSFWAEEVEGEEDDFGPGTTPECQEFLDLHGLHTGG